MSEREELDKEEQALKEAIEALSTPREGGEKTSEYRSELRSETLRDAEKLSMEVRSFVQGVRADFELLFQQAGEKLKLESSLALRIGDYLLRRAALDTSRALSGAAAVTFAALAPASSNTTASTDGSVASNGNSSSSSSESECSSGSSSFEPSGLAEESSVVAETRKWAASVLADDSASPFAERVRSIDRTRAMSGAATSDAAAQRIPLLLAAQQQEEELDESERAVRSAREEQTKEDAGVRCSVEL